MDNTFHQTPAEKLQNRPYNDSMRTFYPGGGPPYPGPRYPGGPPPVQGGSEPPVGMFPHNTPGAGSGPFWPSQDQPDPNACNQWTPPPPLPPAGPAYGGQPYRYPPHLPPPSSQQGLEGYGPPRMAHGYGYDPSMPPPSFNCPLPPSQLPPPPMLNPPGPRPLHRAPPHPDPGGVQGGPPPSAWIGDAGHNTAAGAPNAQRFDQRTTVANLDAGLQGGRYDYQQPAGPGEPDAGQHVPPQQHHPRREFAENRGRPLLSAPPFPPAQGKPAERGVVRARDPPRPSVDEDAVQRTQDVQWVKRFLQNRPRVSKTARSRRPATSVPKARDAIYGAVRLVSRLSLACAALKDNLENEGAWGESYATALGVQAELRERLEPLGDPAYVRGLKRTLAGIAKGRAGRRRRKLELLEERRMEEVRRAEREAVIDKWRTKRVQEVEEKKRELALKLEADGVLAEVRKKQSDVKRMLEILRSLEKLRKLRKEAASRKGIYPEQEADQVFDGQVEKLRVLIRKRTAVYAVEENALRVMLEGEREEERKKDLEKRQRKERERQLQKKREVEAMLFGDELPADHPLQPFTQFYTQAERSLPALIQIRREWDVFLVPTDHPDGTSIPQDWVLPEAPSDLAWASALAST